MQYLQITPQPRWRRVAAAALALAILLGGTARPGAGRHAGSAATPPAPAPSSPGGATAPARPPFPQDLPASPPSPPACATTWHSRPTATVVAWGDNSLGQTDVPQGLSDVVAIGTGASHGLALKANGTVVAWGDNRYGQLAIPSGLQDVTAIAAGWVHNLAVKSDGTVVAWGDNSLGQATVPPGLVERGRRRGRHQPQPGAQRPTAPWSPGAATATAKGRYPLA